MPELPRPARKRPSAPQKRLWQGRTDRLFADLPGDLLTNLRRCLPGSENDWQRQAVLAQTGKDAFGIAPTVAAPARDRTGAIG
jgi:hypothetical protein